MTKETDAQSKKENQRIALTKRLLKESLIAKLNGQSIHKISIRELCEDAGINRTTFYKHYGSQYDLLADMEDELLRHVQESISDPARAEDSDGGVRQVASLLLYLERNEELARLLINNNVEPDFPQKLLYLPKIQSLLRQYLGQRYRQGPLSYVTSFVIYGGYHMVLEWINKDDREPAVEIAELLVSQINRLL